MNPFQLQPHFTVDLPWDKQQAIERLRAAILECDGAAEIESAGTVFDFKIPKHQQRFWSPHLSAQLSPAEAGSQLFARFSPRPEIWTMFMALYFVIAVLMSLSLIVGLAQWQLGYSPWSLLTTPIGALLIGGLHAGSLMGQSWSVDQMELLRNDLDNAIQSARDEATNSSREVQP